MKVENGISNCENWKFTYLFAGKVGKYAGGNVVCPRPTPEWQKGIGMFLVKSPTANGKENDEPTSDEEMGESRAAAGSSV